MTRPTDRTDDDHVFEAPSPGSWGWDELSRVAASHESWHCVAADLLDLKIYEVRIDRPLARRGPDPVGQTHLEKLSGDRAWKNMCVSLAPLIREGRCPAHPPSLHSDDGDEFNAGVVAYDLQINEYQYEGHVRVITELMEQLPSSKKKATALSRELLEHGALPGHEVERIFREVEAQGKGKAKASDDGGR